MADQQMPDERSRVLTLVFTDLADSTALKTKRGDQAVDALITLHREHVARLASECAGRVIDWAGDGCFLTFETSSAGVTFALRLQQAHADEPDLPGVRIGIHLGEVTEKTGPDGAPAVKGLAVDLAARIQGLARPGQVLVSGAVYDSARQRIGVDAFGQPILWQLHGEYTFKGFDKPLDIGEAGLEGLSPLAAPTGSEKALPSTPDRALSRRAPILLLQHLTRLGFAGLALWCAWSLVMAIRLATSHPFGSGQFWIAIGAVAPSLLGTFIIPVVLWRFPSWPYGHLLNEDKKDDAQTSEEAIAEKGERMVLLAAAGMMLGVVLMVSGIGVGGWTFLYGDLTNRPWQWGLVGVAFGCFFGGGGALIGSWYSYRTVEGAADPWSASGWTGLDTLIAVLFAVGAILGIVGLTALPNVNVGAASTARLISLILLLLSLVFGVTRGLHRRAARRELPREDKSRSGGL